MNSELWWIWSICFEINSLESNLEIQYGQRIVGLTMNCVKDSFVKSIPWVIAIWLSKDLTTFSASSPMAKKSQLIPFSLQLSFVILHHLHFAWQMISAPWFHHESNLEILEPYGHRRIYYILINHVNSLIIFNLIGIIVVFFK